MTAQGRAIAAPVIEPPSGQRVAFELTARLITAGILVYAALGKLQDPALLAQSIDNYRVLPAGWSPVMAAVLPTLELTLGAALLAGVLARGASVVACGLLVTFAAAMVQALLRNIDLTCGCFGGQSSQVTWWTVGRNTVLALIAVMPGIVGITPWRRVALLFRVRTRREAPR